VIGFAKEASKNKRACEEIAAMHDRLKMQHAADKEAVESLKIIHSRGIKNHDVVSLRYIISKSRTTTTSITVLEEDIKL
jgi:hypothetical protein